MSKLAVIALAALMLYGCESESQSAKEAGGCPSGAALGEASSLTRLKPGGGKEPTDVMFTAELATPEIRCDYDPDTGEVDARYSFPVSVKRGPAADAGTQTLTYFVAVLDLDNNVVMKRTFTREIALDQLAMTYSESPDALNFSIPKDKKPVGYEVLVGFQLTPDELAYNRERRRYIP